MRKLVAQIAGDLRIVRMTHQRVQVAFPPRANLQITQIEPHDTLCSRNVSTTRKRNNGKQV